MTKEQFNFEKLDVYQKAINMICELYDLYGDWPYVFRRSLGDDLMRAAISIANNIAEGSGRRGRKEKRHFYEISQSSAYECIPMLTVLRRKMILNVATYEHMHETVGTISRMLTGLIKRYS